MMDGVYAGEIRGESKRLSLSCYWLVFTFFILYFNGWLMRWAPGFPSIQRLLTEGLFLGLAVLTIIGKVRSFRFPGLIFLVGYVVWGGASMLFNNSSTYSWYLHCRYHIDLIVFILFLVNSRFTKREMSFIIRCVACILLVQVPAGLVNVALFGRMESNVGAISIGGGGVGTTFSIMGFLFGLGYYFYQKKNIASFLLAFSFLLVGVSNGKRAVLIYAFFFLYIAFFFHAYFAKDYRKFIKNTIALLVVSPLVLFVGLYALSKMLNFEELAQKETTGEKIALVIEIANEYNNKEGEDSMLTQGRFACNKLMMKYLVGGYKDYWFGAGPKTVMGYTRGDTASDVQFNAAYKYGFGYGISGWIYDAISLGAPAMLMHFLFYVVVFLHLLRIPIKILTPQGQALLFGATTSVIALLILHCTYNIILSTSSLIQMVPLGATVLLTAPYYKPYFYTTPDLNYWTPIEEPRR